jgi:hypothetical protein
VVFELPVQPGAHAESTAGQGPLPVVTPNHRSYQQSPLAGSGKPGLWVVKP